jgi:hypothetical protein
MSQTGGSLVAFARTFQLRPDRRQARAAQVPHLIGRPPPNRPRRASLASRISRSWASASSARAAWTLTLRSRARVRACARYGVLVVGEEMKGLVNCNFLPGSARRLELGTVSAEPLSRAYWSQKLRPLGETVGLSRARTSGESPDSTQAGRGPQWPIQLAAISAHPAAMVGTGMPKLRGRTGNEP